MKKNNIVRAEMWEILKSNFKKKSENEEKLQKMIVGGI